MPYRAARDADHPLIEGLRGIAVIAVLTVALCTLAYVAAAILAAVFN